MNFFEALAAKATKAAMDKAFVKGLLRCPKCGQKPAKAPVNVDLLLHCDSCGTDSLPAEWKPDSTGVPTANPDQIPVGTRIQREETATGDCVWHIPASGKFGFFLFFGLFWTAITAAASGAFLFSTPAPGQDPMPWFLYPFFAVFWAVGLGMLYVAVRNKYARHRITVTRDLVTLRREMFGRVKEKSLITSQVNSVAQVVFYQQNYQPVYGVEIRGRDGKLRFGTTLKEDEKAWLVADIKRAVFGENDVIAKTPEMVAAQRQSSFSFPLPPAPRWHWMMGVVFVLIGLGAIAMGVFHGPDFAKHGKDEVNWIIVVFDSLFSLFSLIPIIVGLVFGGIGVVMVYSTWPGREREMRLEGDETQVALRTYQHGRVIKEQSFPRASVSEARATGTGNVNGKPMKRIDLIVDRTAHKITRWTEGDVADLGGRCLPRAWTRLKMPEIFQNGNSQAKQSHGDPASGQVAAAHVAVGTAAEQRGLGDLFYFHVHILGILFRPAFPDGCGKDRLSAFDGLLAENGFGDVRLPWHRFSIGLRVACAVLRHD